MPLSKARDKERKLKIRLEKAVSTPYQSNDVQPKSLFHRDAIVAIQWNPNAKPSREMMAGLDGYDEDGNPIYED